MLPLTTLILPLDPNWSQIHTCHQDDPIPNRICLSKEFVFIFLWIMLVISYKSIFGLPMLHVPRHVNRNGTFLLLLVNF